MQPVFDVAAEQGRVAAALDASGDPEKLSVATRGCNTCGAMPGLPCVSTGMPGVPTTTHVSRLADYKTNSAALAPVDGPAEQARRSLQAAVKAQLLVLCEGDINAKTLGKIQRFCSAMGQAMIGLERPEALVRNRFGMNVALPYIAEDAYEGEGVMATAPGVETYGANMSRGLVAEATKIGKGLLEAQAAAQLAAKKQGSLPELVASLVTAKKQKLGKTIIEAIEKQIAEISTPAGGT